MRGARIIGAWGAAGLASAGLAVPVASARHRATPPPRATLGTIACHQAVNPLRREVSLRATMRPLAHTRSLAIKFALSVRTRGHPATPVVASGLDQWLTPSDPTLGRRPGDIWKLSKPVYNLGAGSYRYVVSFRWLGAKDRVLKIVTRTSSRCTIKELRPDLAVRSVRVSSIAGERGRERYLAVIANRGHSASGPFAVLFEPGVAGAHSQTRQLGSLPAGTRRRLRFTGPACDAASPPTVVADPAGSVDDAQRSNNALTVTCPAG
ncbi:MAG TPA: CARDB domain-containing protein [Solirubrobacteraceae bacterium]|jgi:CARDB protein|nr:CARDB domain-containing protein [Solirubrobacteraceae bacterium]